MFPDNHLFFPPQLPQHHRGRKPTPILSSRENKKTRRVVPFKANRAPSVANHADLHEAVKQHAFLRVQLFVIRAKLFEGQAVKSDGTLHNVHFRAGHAHQQQGRSSVKGEHAAHASECAGMEENIKEQWLFDIERSGEITPRKKKNFKLRGVSEIDIQKMDQSLRQGLKIRDSLRQLMPGPGFLDHTQADDLLNATDQLPSEVNLLVDKILENGIRGRAAELTERIAKSQITVKLATEKYVQSAKKIFSAYLGKLKEEHLGIVKTAQITQEQIFRKMQIERLMSYVEDELSGTVMPPEFLF